MSELREFYEPPKPSPKPKPKTRKILGMKPGEFIVVLVLACLVCVALPVAGYFIYTSGALTGVPGIAPQPTITAVVTNTPVDTDTPQPTATVLTPTVTLIPLPTSLATSNGTPLVQDTPSPVATGYQPPTDTPTGALGSYKNPIPIGTGYTFDGLGNLSIVNSSWTPNKKGLSVVYMIFQCQVPQGQQCNVSDLQLYVIGGTSGRTYGQEQNNPDVPQPTFNGFNNPPVMGGTTEYAYAGFSIRKAEATIIMRINRYNTSTVVYFTITKF
jgi:hypothetical protein